MPHPADFLIEPQRKIPVAQECDVCVIGGSCTGVFAAVRAARLGARVVLVERSGAFGGVATLSLVNVWHSTLDTIFEKPIIGGLTSEVLDRLAKRNAMVTRERSSAVGYVFNPFEMMLELDRLVLEHSIIPMLHTLFVAPLISNGRLDAVVIEDKTGRRAIRARYFIDASGDGDLAHRAGAECYRSSHLQPSTTCAILGGWPSLAPTQIGDLLAQHGQTLGIPLGFAWGSKVPGTDQYMLAATRVLGLDPSVAEDLTRSEIEGRRQIRGILDLIKSHAPHANVSLTGLPARIGLRESRHVRCLHQLTGDEVLNGKRFDDAIANGSYRVDVHHQDKPGITFKYLDGTQIYSVPGHANVNTRWRDPIEKDPTFYQVPYRSIVPGNFPNLLLAGRMLDADSLAHAAVRVMVNMNQTGEAAGVACVLAMQTTDDVRTIDTQALRRELAAGGSVVI